MSFLFAAPTGIAEQFARAIVPYIKWGLLPGVLLCNARAMGEFGTVSVVSGHIPGLTETMPLRIESLYNDYQEPAAFAIAALLACWALLTLATKRYWNGAKDSVALFTREHRA